MNDKIMNHPREQLLLFVFLISIPFLFSSCSRYSPTAVIAPKEKILDINIITRQPVTDEFYYYFVFDLENRNGGPQPFLSGTESAKNWNYYIRLYRGELTDKSITATQDIIDPPNPFNSLSTGYKYYQVTANTIQLWIKPDNLKNNFKLNFITSRDPLTPSRDDLTPIDYLYNSTLDISLSTGSQYFSDSYPNIKNINVTEEKDQPANIVSWSVYVRDI